MFLTFLSSAIFPLQMRNQAIFCNLVYHPGRRLAELGRWYKVRQSRLTPHIDANNLNRPVLIDLDHYYHNTEYLEDKYNWLLLFYHVIFLRVLVPVGSNLKLNRTAMYWRLDRQAL